MTENLSFAAFGGMGRTYHGVFCPVETCSDLCPIYVPLVSLLSFSSLGNAPTPTMMMKKKMENAYDNDDWWFSLTLVVEEICSFSFPSPSPPSLGKVKETEMAA